MQRFDYDNAPGNVFFNDEATGKSSFGSFPDDDKNVWDQSKINDSIQFGRPDLFKALQRLPISAEDLPTPAVLGTYFLTPDERVLVDQSAVITSRGSLANPHLPPSVTQCQNAGLYQFRTLKLQHKRYIQTRILSGHAMLLRCANQFSCYFPCSAPHCNGAVGRGGFFVTMRSTRDQQDAHYCMKCFEDLMEQNMTDTVRRTHQQLQYYMMDGNAESRPSSDPMPYNFPSNSVENQRLRQKRAEEIDEVLHSVKKRKQVSTASNSDSDNEVSLRIERPDDLEEADQRYKKQRRTQYDQRKDRIASKQDEQQQQQDQEQRPSETQAAAPGPIWKEEPRLICYCREPEGVSQLVRCHNEYCLIGLFHVKCCTNDPRLLMNRKFFCDFCVDRATTSESVSPVDTFLDVQPNGLPSTTTPIIARTPSYGSDDDQQKMDDEEGMFPMDDIDGDARDGDADFSSPTRALPAPPSAGGFTPINQRFRSVDDSPRPMYLDGTTDGKLRPVATYRLPPPLVADFASLADFAPFMSYEVFPHSPTGLQEGSIVRFEAWRYSMPGSRLFANLKLGGVVKLQDLPRGPRQDLRKQARKWIDRLVHEEHKKLDGRLCAWMEGAL